MTVEFYGPREIWWKFIWEYKRVILMKACHSHENGNPEYNVLMSKTYYVYILASKRNGTLYVGVTNNLVRRIFEHKNGLADGFTKKYGIHTLVYFDQTNDAKSALIREKQLKKWNRKWKLDLIEKVNPEWKDLSKDWIPDQVGNDNSTPVSFP